MLTRSFCALALLTVCALAGASEGDPTLHEPFQEDDRKGVCNLLSVYFGEGASERPTVVDDTTWLTSLGAVFVDGRCLIHANYVIDEDKIIGGLVERFPGMSRLQLEEELFSEKGRESFRANLQRGVRTNPGFKKALELDFVDVQASYLMKRHKLDHLTLVISGGQ